MSDKHTSTTDEIVYFNDKEPKIEIANCPYDNKDCVHQLPDINKLLHEANLQREVKDYKRTIDTLKLAFDLTYDIKRVQCQRCAALFRYCIISSMMITRSELKDMKVKWFNARRFNDNLELATTTLKEMNNKMQKV